MKRYIRSAEILPNKQIQVGMYWNIDGHDMTVTWVSEDRKKCKITETWISEDTYRPKRSTETYDIRVDNNGTEYAKNPEYDQYEDIGVYYSTGAFNYPYESVVDDSDEDDWGDDWEEDDYYTPSSTARDYGPSNPWDAPGMSIHDFI